MIFWLAIAIVVAVFIYNGFIKRYADLEEAFIGSFIAVVVLAIIVPIIAVVSPKDTKPAGTWTQSLVQLQEYRSAGKIFIENDPNEVEYVYKDARGALVQGEVWAGDAAIHEGSKTATVKTTATDHFNHWVLPWNMSTSYRYDFNVPAGSVFQEVEARYESEDD